MTRHSRHTAPEKRPTRAPDPAKSHQGAYGSGGSYGVGGAFEDDEPGSRVEEGDGASGAEAAPERSSPLSDE